MSAGSGARRSRRSRVWSHDPRKRSRVGLGVGFASMIDVVFLLLMYFLLTMDFREPERAIGVLAPAASAASDPFAFPVEPVVVRVGVDGVVAEIEGVEIASGVDGDALAAALVEQIDVTILGDEDVEVVAGAGVAWDAVYGVMDGLAAAGFDSIRFDSTGFVGGDAE